MQEVWIQAVKIQAKHKKEAIDLVADGQGDFLESNDTFMFSHTLPRMHGKLKK